MVNQYAPIENKADIWDILYNISKLERKNKVNKYIVNSTYYLKRLAKMKFIMKQFKTGISIDLIMEAPLNKQLDQDYAFHFDFDQYFKYYSQIVNEPYEDDKKERCSQNNQIEEHIEIDCEIKNVEVGNYEKDNNEEKKIENSEESDEKYQLLVEITDFYEKSSESDDYFAYNHFKYYSENSQNVNELYEGLEEEHEKIKNVKVGYYEKNNSNEQTDELFNTNEVQNNENYQNTYDLHKSKEPESTKIWEKSSESDDFVSKFLNY